MRINKTILLIAIILVVTGLLAGCGSSASKASLVEGKVNVVTSFYPLYDFTRKIGGDNVNVINLVPAGVEPHDWSPKSQDMKNITKAQLFIYQGAGFEGWVNDFLSSLQANSKLQVIEASKGVDLLKASEETGQADLQYDPHAWMSPRNAVKMSENILNGLISVDPSHEADYRKNYDKLAADLNGLDAEYKQQLATTTKKEIAVSHQAFAYLCRDYGLTQMPIMGLSPDSEPTAQDLKKMNEFIKSHDVKYIFFEELVSDKLAKTLAKDAHVDTMVLNPLEGLTENQLKAGEDYISIMNKNLKNLLKALQ
jgi:zinc transport system substrate-binding protein